MTASVDPRVHRVALRKLRQVGSAESLTSSASRLVTGSKRSRVIGPVSTASGSATSGASASCGPTPDRGRRRPLTTTDKIPRPTRETSSWRTSSRASASRRTSSLCRSVCRRGGRRDRARQAGNQRGHRVASCEVLRHVGGVLDQPAEPLRAEPRRGPRGRADRSDQASSVGMSGADSRRLSSTRQSVPVRCWSGVSRTSGGMRPMLLRRHRPVPREGRRYRRAPSSPSSRRFSVHVLSFEVLLVPSPPGEILMADFIESFGTVQRTLRGSRWPR